MKLILSELYSDDDLETLKGKYLDDEYIHTMINESCDIYSDTGEFILSFKKDIISEHNRNIGFNNFKNCILPSRGRGASAGEIDPEAIYWKKRKIVKNTTFSTKYLKADGTESKMKVNNPVYSTAYGYFEKQKQLNYDSPCRMTSYTKNKLKNYEEGLPFIDEIAEYYKKIRPEEYKIQYDRAHLNEFHINDTPFSTITINRNFRTGLHQDAGDFGGVACLTVLEEGLFNGGILMFPKYGIGINMRQGDLLIANVHNYHCNTELWTTKKQDEYNKFNTPSFKKVNKEIGVLGSDKDYTRMSFVCYLREKLIDCA